MNAASEKSPKGLRGIAALYDDMERKNIFRKYLYFLGWVELGILLTCWLYQIGDSGQDVSPSFHGGYTFSSLSWPPSRSLSCWAPSLSVSTGISQNPEQAEPVEPEFEAGENAGAGKIQQLSRMVALVQKLPFLALLLLLGLSVAFLYKLDVIGTLIGNVGERSVRIVLTSLGVVCAARLHFRPYPDHSQLQTAQIGDGIPVQGPGS